ncbi:hypothetical protein ACA910_000586 [Epithemia clementina (nom. ined.)]
MTSINDVDGIGTSNTKFCRTGLPKDDQVHIETKVDLPGTISVDVINSEVKTTAFSIWQFSKLSKNMKTIWLLMKTFLDGMGCESLSPFIREDWSNTHESLGCLHAIIKTFRAKKKGAPSNAQTDRNNDNEKETLNHSKSCSEDQLEKARNCLLQAFVNKSQSISASNLDGVGMIRNESMDEKLQSIDNDEESLESIDDFGNHMTR